MGQQAGVGAVAERHGNKMIDEHNEIEVKLDATGVDLDEFKKFCEEKKNRFLCVLSPDTYYENGNYVVRHRKSKNPDRGHELTVKRRKSERSTRDREEIDLFFAERTKQKDVAAFLAATGYVEAFTLTKQSHIYYIDDDGVPISAVLYDVCVGPAADFDVAKARRFIEVEVEKGAPVSVDTAKRLLGTWVQELKSKFPVLADRQPLNDSLYEIYSGKKYQTVG